MQSRVRSLVDSRTDHAVTLGPQKDADAVEIRLLRIELAQRSKDDVECRLQEIPHGLEDSKHKRLTDDMRLEHSTVNKQLDCKQTLSTKVLSCLPTPQQSSTSRQSHVKLSASSQRALVRQDSSGCKSSPPCDSSTYSPIKKMASHLHSHGQDIDSEEVPSTGCSSVVQDVDHASMAGRSTSNASATAYGGTEDFSYPATLASGSAAGSDGAANLADLKEEISALRQMYHSEIAGQGSRGARREQEDCRVAATAAAATAALMSGGIRSPEVDPLGRSMRASGNVEVDSLGRSTRAIGNPGGLEATRRDTSRQVAHPKSSGPQVRPLLQPVLKSKQLQPPQGTPQVVPVTAAPQPRSGSPRRSPSPCRAAASHPVNPGLQRATSASLLPNATLAPAVSSLARNQSVTVLGRSGSGLLAVHPSVHCHGMPAAPPQFRSRVPHQRA